MSSRHRGQSLVHAAVSKAEKAQQHTAPTGQQQMKADSDQMVKGYDQLVQRMTSTREKLQVKKTFCVCVR